MSKCYLQAVVAEQFFGPVADAEVTVRAFIREFGADGFAEMVAENGVALIALRRIVADFEAADAILGEAAARVIKAAEGL